MLRKEVEELRKEKQELLINHSKEITRLRQKIVDHKIVKQRISVLEGDLKKEKRKNEERRRELEKEQAKRRLAEKQVKMHESGSTGKSTEKLEAEKKERCKVAEQMKDEFWKKQGLKRDCEDSRRVRKREDLDEDEWLCERGVTIQKPSSKRGRGSDQNEESVDRKIKKETVGTEARDQRQARQERSIVGEAGMVQKSSDKCWKLKIESRLLYVEVDNLLSAIRGQGEQLN